MKWGIGKQTNLLGDTVFVLSIDDNWICDKPNNEDELLFSSPKAAKLKIDELKAKGERNLFLVERFCRAQGGSYSEAFSKKAAINQLHRSRIDGGSRLLLCRPPHGGG